MTAALESPVTAATVALETRELSHRYGRRTALEPLSFALQAPGVAAVTGPNGSGKSTLLRIVAGLLRPSRGTSTLTVGGRAIAPAERRRWAGFAAPDLMFYEELSVAENLTFVAETRGIPAPAAAAAAALG
ncbi:MAG: ABC transporter ATP-binding protein, partial [Candidatus Eiseniibacteriota bacterium]